MHCCICEYVVVFHAPLDVISIDLHLNKRCLPLIGDYRMSILKSCIKVSVMYET